MYLLYLDDSGAIDDPGCDFSVLAGFSIFETGTHWVEQDLEAIAHKHFPNFEMEFHGAPMRCGRGMWRGIPKEARFAALEEALGLIRNRKSAIRVFASVVDKKAASGLDISEYHFTQVSSRFDMFLQRIYRREKRPARGIVILDKSKSEYAIQRMARTFKHSGHAYGLLRNFSEVPLFLDSQSSRLIQLADLVAYSIYRQYQKGDDRFFSIVRESFDSEGSLVHGLHVLS